MGDGYFITAHQSGVWPLQRVITGIVSRIFRRYISTSGSHKLAIYRLSSKRLLARRREGQEASDKSCFFILLFYIFSQASSRAQSRHPVRSFPRLCVGGGRTRPGSRVAPVGRPTPYTRIGRPGFRISTAGPSRPTCVSRRSPLVAVVPWRAFFSAVPPELGDKFVTPPPFDEYLAR